MNSGELGMAGGELSKEAFRRQVSRFLDEEPDDEDNLMDFGLSSIATMQLISEWKDAGIEVNFVELARRPTLSGMWDVLQAKRQAAVPLARHGRLDGDRRHGG